MSASRNLQHLAWTSSRLHCSTGFARRRRGRRDRRDAPRRRRIRPARIGLGRRLQRRRRGDSGEPAPGTDPEGNRVVFRFGVRNPDAEAWLREHSAALVTHIVEDQRNGIRMALSEGLALGQNPRQTALDVVGRVSRVTNRREGGIIGLTAAQERYVATARQDLLSGDPERLRHYLTLCRRDKRFDKAVMKAIQDGKTLPVESVNRIIGRYSDRLLELRGEMLARIETMMALGKSRYDAIRQQISAGKVAAEDVTKVWRSAGDSRVRHTHRALNGDTVGYREAFQSPSGRD